MKVLITGATGFIGTHVLQELLKYEDIEIIAVISPGTIPKILNSKLTYYHKKELPRIEIPEAIIHLAWCELDYYHSRNHIGFAVESYEYLKRFIDLGVRNITVTGTCFEYGKKEFSLFETDLADPQNNYAIGKDVLRRMLSGNDIELKWLRLFYLYGEGQRESSLIPKLEKAVMNGELEFLLSGYDKIRDYLHVEKVAEYIVKCALQNSITGIINISSNEPVTIERFLSDYIKEKGYNIKIKRRLDQIEDLGSYCFWGNNEKLKKVLGKYEV